ncbi:flavin-containing monooxygenase [Caldimonas brevitalea]|uniref:FAD-containing monooxygenase EthA n=1 Tax=Caldimonas brevitalea TaxID=413882 RepID=A0A0G3BP34_9BURK|nr:NAD(P)/FAD-dependent oxidoreductase [Caldimonas brevitalea]AKJ29126.1 FAD-containing monooxygenase EthA [Caldimonas brevitalea]
MASWQACAAAFGVRRRVKPALGDLSEAGPTPADASSRHVDVLIVGAGLSGIGAAVHLQTRCPSKRYAVLEARGALGGTWDLFRYPGIRSDSDMYTLGYAFKPWANPKAIADGPSIRRYVEETAAEHGIDQHIRYHHRVVRAEWSSQDACWRVDVDVGHGEQRERHRYTCRFLSICSGYYSYREGHRPEFPGEARFQGTIVHPQFWPEQLDHAGKRVVVIGSGATAVTLVPEMAKTAAHVTMLQRSPTYVFALPSRDAIAETLKRWLPPLLAYRLVRTKNVLLGVVLYRLARQRPRQAKDFLVRKAREQLGPRADDHAPHFTPRYNPWDQRLCAVPDGDMFDAIKTGRASVVTDQIDTFTERGIRLKSGQELEADIIVTATGLKLNVLGDVEFHVDGRRCDFSKTLAYKAMMFSGVPNLAYTFGYTNASWTLKADLTARYVCRLLQHMDRHGYVSAVPTPDASVEPRPFLDFTSGYVVRAVDLLPKQGSKKPWRLYQNYVLDLLTLRFGRIDDGSMRFSQAAVAHSEARAGAA